jgi:hypothetical protein
MTKNANMWRSLLEALANSLPSTLPMEASCEVLKSILYEGNPQLYTPSRLDPSFTMHIHSALLASLLLAPDERGDFQITSTKITLL